MHRRNIHRCGYIGVRAACSENPADEVVSDPLWCPEAESSEDKKLFPRKGKRLHRTVISSVKNIWMLIPYFCFINKTNILWNNPWRQNGFVVSQWHFRVCFWGPTCTQLEETKIKIHSLNFTAVAVWIELGECAVDSFWNANLYF